MMSSAVQATLMLTQCVLTLCVAVYLHPVSTAVDTSQGDIGTVHAPRCSNCFQPCSRAVTRGKWPKIKHHPRCTPNPLANRSDSAVAAARPAKQSRKRRAESDPGESPESPAPQTLTRRVSPPQPASTSRKLYNTRREEQIMRLLDVTHARRMAAEAAAEAKKAAAAVGE